MNLDLAETIQNKASEMCRQRVEIDQPLWSTRLLDSLARVELAFFVADTAGLELAEEDIRSENFESVRHILRFVESRKGSA